MKTLSKLAVLGVVGTASLALAGNALAVQKLSVSQTSTALTIKVSQTATDQQPAKITIYVPTGYSINRNAPPSASSPSGCMKPLRATCLPSSSFK